MWKWFIGLYVKYNVYRFVCGSIMFIGLYVEYNVYRFVCGV